MKNFTICTCLFALFPVFAQEAPTKSEASADGQEQVDPQLLPNQQAFLKLPEERRQEFGKHVQEAYRLFQQKRIFETMDQLYKAEAIFKDSPEILNLRGSCYVEIRNFDKALVAFEAALKLSPGNASIAFNIAEVHFVTQKWEKALELFEKVLTMIPDQGISLSRLTEFKIMLCKKKLGQEEEVIALSEKYDYTDDSPYYYFAQAALAYSNGDGLAAEQWLARANRVFRDPAILSPWQDTLVEFGYIKSFYGGEELLTE